MTPGPLEASAGAQSAAAFDKTLFVLAQIPHWVGPDGSLRAYEPYVREMRVWADLFARVEICYPPAEGPMTGNLATYERDNIVGVPVLYSLQTGGLGALRRLSRVPGLFAAAIRGIARADLTLLRSPAHFALVGALLCRATGRPSITKWAGENGAYPGERLPSRADRGLQAIPSGRHPVLVYGPARRPHQISFLPALMTAEELRRARELSAVRRSAPPWRILSVGRLTPVKGFDLAIRGLAALLRDHPSLPWSYTLVGDGESRLELERLAVTSGIAERITFTGALSFHDVQTLYASSHVALMPGVKEGWPKVIAEAWAHGVVPVAAAAGLVPWILREKDAGVLFEPTAEGLAAAVARVLSDPAAWSAHAGRMPRRAEEFSLDEFGRRLRQVLVDRFGYV